MKSSKCQRWRRLFGVRRLKFAGSEGGDCDLALARAHYPRSRRCALHSGNIISWDDGYRFVRQQPYSQSIRLAVYNRQGPEMPPQPMVSSNLRLHHFVSALPVRGNVAHRKHALMFSSLSRLECHNKNGNDMNALFGRMAFLVSYGSGEYTRRTLLRQEAQRMQRKEEPRHTIRSEQYFEFRSGICLSRSDNRMIVSWSIRCVSSQQQSHVSVEWTFSESYLSG